MCNPGGKKNLMSKGRVLFNMQPSKTSGMTIFIELMSEMGKLLQKVQNEVRGLQGRRRLPPVPIEKPKERKSKGKSPKKEQK